MIQRFVYTLSSHTIEQGEINMKELEKLKKITMPTAKLSSKAVSNVIMYRIKPSKIMTVTPAGYYITKSHVGSNPTAFNTVKSF